ncbi:MAG: tetratricopeptide repeat protein [Planctomycetota bacterium]
MTTDSPTLRPIPPAVVACSWTTFVVGTLLVLLALTSAHAQSPAQPASATAATSASDASRLLEAEILELAEGDLDAAMKVYREVVANKSVEPSLAARALFALGRCYRKKGELGAARDRFREVADRFPGQARVADLARRFAAEIDAGRSEIPEFDWLEQVGANAEIQARIFDLGMQLVHSPFDKEAGPRAAEAKKQLRALGVITVPILEPMLENSRDPQHRVALADLLVGLGRVERLNVLFPLPPGADLPGYFTGNFLGRLRQLPVERQKAAARILESIELDPSDNLQALLATLRIGLGGTTHLEKDLPFLSSHWQMVERAVLDNRANAERLARFLASEAHVPTSTDGGAAFRARVARSILEHRPELLTEAQLASIRDAEVVHGTNRVRRPSRFLEELAKLVTELMAAQRMDDVHFLVEGARPKLVMLTLCEYPEATIWKERGSSLEVTAQASILRAAGAYNLLHRLALEHDEAIPSFEAFLLESARIGGEWRSTTSVYHSDDWSEYVDSVWREVAFFPGRIHYSPEFKAPMISPAFAEAMLRVLREARDPLPRAVALDALCRASPLHDAAHAQPMIEILRANQARPNEEDAWITLLAAAGALAHSAHHESVASVSIPMIASLVNNAQSRFPQFAASAFVVASSRESDEPGAALTHVTFEFMSKGSHLYGNSPLRAAESVVSLLHKHSSTGPAPKARVEAIADVLLDALVRGEAIQLFDLYLAQGVGSSVRKKLASRLSELGDDEAVSVALRRLFYGREAFDELEEFPTEVLSRAIQNPAIDFDLRKTVVEKLLGLHSSTRTATRGRRRSPENRQRRFESADRVLNAVDWKTMIETQPKFVTNFVHRDSFSQLHQQAWTLIQSEDPTLRKLGYQRLDEESEHMVQALDRGLEETDSSVKKVVLRRLYQMKTTAGLPLLYALLETGNRTNRISAMDRLGFLADERSLPKVARFLTHSDFSLREKALETLQAIEQKLEDQKKWLERYGKDAPQNGGTPK